MPGGAAGVKMTGMAKKPSNAARVKPKCQLRHQKCYPLEPVLEHCASNVDEAPRKEQLQHSKPQCSAEGKKSLLSKMRDRYVKLMNDMASSADLTGVSGLYGCPTGQTDFPAMAAMRAAKEDEEIEQLAAQMAASGKAASITPSEKL